MSFATFFSTLQETPWYREFLNPVMDKIENNSTLLDIGTGSGKMLEILYTEKNVNCVGTDTSEDMIKQAEIKLKDTNIKLHLTPAGEALPFNKNSFDAITICSVLFHLKKEDINQLLNNALELLKEDGKIIIHTPTGKGNICKLTRHYFSFKNKSIYIWYRSTKKRAKVWTKENYLAEYSTMQKLTYNNEIVMNGFAQVETITK